MRDRLLANIFSKLIALYFVSLALFGVFFAPDESMSPVLRWSHDRLRWPMAIVCVWFAIRLWRNPIDLVRSKPTPFGTNKHHKSSSNGHSG